MRQNRLRAATVLLLLIAAIASAQTSGPGSKRQPPKPQIIKLSFDDKGYVVTPSRVTKGIPVRMDVDLATVKGCMRTVVIAAFDVKKTVKEGDTAIEFTPTKSGEIQIVCGMNMGKGSFTVAESR